MNVKLAAPTPPAPISPSVETNLRRGSLLGGLLVATIGLLVLAGWLFDIAELKSLHPTWAAMKANVAICLLLLGASLVVFGVRLSPEWRRPIVQVLAAAYTALVLEGETSEEEWEEIEEAARTITRAGWWIDQRSSEPGDLTELLEAATGADRPTENPHF